MGSERLKRLPNEVVSLIRSTFAITTLPQAVLQLVHNALDADATSIEVGVETSIWSCSVTDNGHGIHPGEFQVLGQRYFTSKYYGYESPQGTCPFGYRGEALANLADLSLLEIISRHTSCDKTYSVIYRGGNRIYHGPAKHSQKTNSGTSVIARDLFYRWPVRRKQELNRFSVIGAIKRMIEVLALMNPMVSFKLIDYERPVNNNNILHIQGRTEMDLFTRWKAVIGSDAHVQDVAYIDECIDNYRLQGFILPQASFNHKHQYIYLDSHPISTCEIHRQVNDLVQKSNFGQQQQQHQAQDSLTSRYQSHVLYLFNFKPLDRRRRINWHWQPDPDKGHIDNQDSEPMTKILIHVIGRWLRDQGYITGSSSLKTRETQKDDDNDDDGVSTVSGQHQRRRRVNHGIKNKSMTKRAKSPGPVNIDRSSLTRFKKHKTDDSEQDQVPSWIKDVLAEWKSPVYRTGPTPINSLELSASATTAELERHCAISGTGGLEGTLDRQSLVDANFLAQVDEKWLLILCNSGYKTYATQTQTPSQSSPSSSSSPLVLILVDQHAADERIRIENFIWHVEKQVIEQGRVESCYLKEPLTILIPYSSMVLLQERDQIRDIFKLWGFEIVDFDNDHEEEEQEQESQPLASSYGQVNVNCVPQILWERLQAEPNLIQDLICEHLSVLENVGNNSIMSLSLSVLSCHKRGVTKLAGNKIIRTIPELFMRLLVSKACRGAIMFNDPLSNDQCRALLQGLAQTNYPFQCAHGRPTMVPITAVQRKQNSQFSDTNRSVRPLEWNKLLRY